MGNIPEIRGLAEEQDFHDSSLIDVQINPQLASIRIIVSTPDANRVEHLWMLTFGGVLRFEYETVGDGEAALDAAPLEIYDIYDNSRSTERQRWIERLVRLGVSRQAAAKVHHIVLASSFARGWGGKEHLDGIQIVCRSVLVERAPADYRGSEFRRPRIKADED